MGLGTGAIPGKSLAWSDLLTACLSLVGLGYYIMSFGKSEEAKEQQKSNGHIQWVQHIKRTQDYPSGGGWGNEDGMDRRHGCASHRSLYGHPAERCGRLAMDPQK